MLQTPVTKSVTEVAPKYSGTTEMMIPSVDTIKISGTLEYAGRDKLMILVAGSGPTDRDCNSADLNTNAFKMIADTLVTMGYSSFRYDKRGIGESTRVGEELMTLTDRVDDINNIVEFFKSDFSEIIIFGHSEGALVGAIASEQSGVDGFVSACGMSITMDKMILEQLEKYPKALPLAQEYIEKIKQGEDDFEINPALQSVFRPSLFKFYRVAMSLDPQVEIAKLTMPTLVVGGACDIQVAASHAEALQQAQPTAQLLVIDNMGHVLKEISADCSDVNNAYRDGGLPLNGEFVSGLRGFLDGI